MWAPLHQARCTGVGMSSLHAVCDELDSLAREIAKCREYQAEWGVPEATAERWCALLVQLRIEIEDHLVPRDLPG